jgi:ATP-dependent Clp protease ATP-binding subunit ClpA
MFERFTERARRAVVLAQEEARGLRHNYIGTEHLLLGLCAEPEGVAARALVPFGVSLVAVRAEVTKRAEPGQKQKAVRGHIPFTPRAKKVLELALREALRLGNNYIGTEQILLGLIAERDGAGAQILAAQAGDLAAVRTAVIELIPGAQETVDASEALRAPPAVEAILTAAARLAGPVPVGSHHLLLAALDDPSSAAVRALDTAGVDLDRARTALRDVDIAGTSDEPPDQEAR